ncbi:sigma factor-like helix-turn-helix DNA-binding protein [Actinomadura rudentiformis]|uniref:sigma factor-like helix-turn-helix DNA-binding protein n=1 Tax=Actinomadura rudentiformis TaxID=359158 RepID=UPI001CEF9532|nr:sigma factor-like helix-turn-helix DNA-binding protein [Actinomadura rudentiformis]
MAITRILRGARAVAAPDRLLDQLAEADPAAVVEGRESVAPAFIVALQRLPATQRAALILKDVLGWTSAEAADLLGTTATAINSMAQRARGTLTSPGPRRPLDHRDEAVLGRVRRSLATV